MSELRKKALFQQIADIVRKDIAANYKPGDRLASDLEMARRFSVSNVTIREAMLSLCQEGLLERRHGSGTYVTSTTPITRTPSDQHVAIWTELDIAEPRTSWFYSRTIQGLRVFLEEQHIPYKLYLGRRKPWEPLKTSTCPQLWKDIEANRIKGVLALGASPPWLSERLQADIPVVGWNDAYPHRVSMNYFDLVRLAVEHLLANGRRRILMLSWDVSKIPATNHAHVTKAFEKVLHEHKASLQVANMHGELHPSQQALDWEEFKTRWTESDTPPDGLIVSDDILYRDAAMSLLALGVRIPDELMVVTHANKGSGMYYPFPTARLELDVEQVVRQTGDFLVNLMNGRQTSLDEIEVPLQWIDGTVAPGVKARKRPFLVKPRRAVSRA